MTKLLYLDDPYLTECKARVVSLVDDEKAVLLDQTIFYPISGGQLNDKGKICLDEKEFKILNVKKRGSDILHCLDEQDYKELKEIQPLTKEISCYLDWGRRYIMMRMHSAAHIISGIMAKLLKAKITGNQLGEEYSRIDFSVQNQEGLTKELVTKIEELSNDIVKKGLNIRVKYLKRAELKDKEELIKLVKGIPEHIEIIRIIEIEGFDAQPCGGTHVRNTKEVGTIKIIKTENKGKHHKRIYFKLLS